MILRYTVDDFPANSGVVYPSPPLPRKRNRSRTAKRTEVQSSERIREGERPQQHSRGWGWVGGGGPAVERESLAEWGSYFSSAAPEQSPGCHLPFPNPCVHCCDIPTFGKGCPSPNILYYLMLGERGALSRLRLDPQRCLHVCVIWLWGFLFSRQAALGTLIS